MKAITITQHWVLDFVIGLNLCPFARQPFNKQKIRFATTEETDPEEILLSFWEEVQLLHKTPLEIVSNTLFILAKVDWDFETFLDIYYVAEELLEEQGMHEFFQLAGFHPDFQFEETGFEEPVNFVNRSPIPMIHILRVDEVADAIESHPDAEGIPDRNKNTLDSIGYKELEKRFKMVYRETDN
ncbi:MAG: DUF1415 domain-containing protein [Saprospiraceae bacterium]|nr:DUF1415 domain-containing protein [Saprospiraceae bacterium]